MHVGPRVTSNLANTRRPWYRVNSTSRWQYDCTLCRVGIGVCTIPSWPQAGRGVQCSLEQSARSACELCGRRHGPLVGLDPATRNTCVTQMLPIIPFLSQYLFFFFSKEPCFVTGLHSFQLNFFSCSSRLLYFNGNDADKTASKLVRQSLVLGA